MAYYLGAYMPTYLQFAREGLCARGRRGLRVSDAYGGLTLVVIVWASPGFITST